jgi:hypothetical protein
MTQQINGLDTAQVIYQANVSPRARTLIELESEVDGTRFDHREPWTNTEVPIYDRRPCIVYQAAENAIQSKVDLLLGDGRFPVATSRPEEDESDEDDESEGLNKEDSKKVDALIVSIITQAKLRPLFRETYASAQGCGTAVALLGQRKGKLFAETLPAKWCTPKRNSDGDIESVEVSFPYIKNELVNGKWEATCWLYRRVIDQKSDTVFAPGKASADCAQPSWQVLSTAPHGFGFCPVVWYRHNAPMMTVEGDDGNAVHRTILDELEGIDYALSQRHHGALHSLPQMYEIGVEPGYNPTSDGEQGDSIQVTQNGGTPNSVSNPVVGGYVSKGRRLPRGARKKGPGFVNQYPDAATKVGSIDTPGDALKSISDHIHDLRNKICETLAWVPLDPESIKFAATVSGKALEILRERELNRVSRDREGFGDGMMLPVVNMLLRIALHFGTALQTRKLKGALPVIKTFSKGGIWQDPELKLKWPSYFLQGADDNAKTVGLAIEAFDGGVITRRTQVETVARIFGIDNVTEYMSELEEENEAKAEKLAEEQKTALAKMHASGMTGLDEEDDSDEPPGSGGAARGSPKPAPAGRSGKPGSLPGPKRPVT